MAAVGPGPAVLPNPRRRRPRRARVRRCLEAVQDGYERYHGRQAVEPAARGVPRLGRQIIPTSPGRCKNCWRGSRASMAVVRRSIGTRALGASRSRPATGWISPTRELLATTSCPAWTNRGQRLDVANTIYYRRRKGTVALLEQLRPRRHRLRGRVIELFSAGCPKPAWSGPGTGPGRREPTPSAPAPATRRAAPGLLTRTPAGGWGRHCATRFGAALYDGPYDEYHHPRGTFRPGAATSAGTASARSFLSLAHGGPGRHRGHPVPVTVAAQGTSRSTRPDGRSHCSPRPGAAETTTVRAGFRWGVATADAADRATVGSDRTGRAP